MVVIQKLDFSDLVMPTCRSPAPQFRVEIRKHSESMSGIHFALARQSSWSRALPDNSAAVWERCISAAEFGSAAHVFKRPGQTQRTGPAAGLGRGSDAPIDIRTQPARPPAARAGGGRGRLERERRRAKKPRHSVQTARTVRKLRRHSWQHDLCWLCNQRAWIYRRTALRIRFSPR